MPKSWGDGRDRCHAAKVPDEREFATKNTLTAAIVQRSPASPLPIVWVTADAAYGQDDSFRRMLEASGVGYVLAVPKSQFSLAGPRIDMAFEQAPARAWERRSCGGTRRGGRRREVRADTSSLDHTARQELAGGRRRGNLALRTLRRNATDQVPVVCQYHAVIVPSLTGRTCRQPPTRARADRLRRRQATGLLLPDRGRWRP
ncbi:transposase [Streptomyces sp. NPDC088115]|uniref:transposase n=1 Tax=Streptomyces sp. NPDC088115 TaxID=3365824 RepID=UPI00381025F9